MKIRKLTALILAALILMSGCAKSATESNYQMSETYDTGAGVAAEATEETGGEQTASESPFAEYDFEEKIIYSGRLEIETMEYEKTIESLETWLEEKGGFKDSAEYFDDSRYDRYDGNIDKGTRSARITVRVPAENFNDFMENGGNLGVVVDSGIFSENVTVQYNDRSMELESLKIQHENLLKMLEKTENISDMLAIESSLSDVRWRINSIESELTNLDRRIAYSTVEVNIREVTRLSERESESFAVQIKRAFVNGFEDYGQGIKNLFLSVVRNLPAIITAAVLIFVIVRAVKAKKSRKNAKKEENTEDKKSE